MAAARGLPSPGEPPVPDSEDAGVEAGRPSPALRLVVRREHSLLALMELSRALWRDQDVHSLAKSLLLNVMGQTGSARAALWLRSPGGRGLPVLIQSHGLGDADAAALMMACWPPLLERFAADPRPLRAYPTPVELDRAARALVRRSRIAIFAPMRAESEIVGLLALGAPAGGHTVQDLDLQLLEASLDIAGVALRGAHLQGRVLESHRQLAAANESLRELDRLKTEFVDNVNHELRTPLTIVLGCLQCMTEQDLAPQAARGLVESASRSAKHLLRLVESLLTFSSASQGTLSVHLVQADAAKFLAAYHERRRPGVSSGLRELRLESPEGERWARFDPHRLRAVLDELVDNAVKFTPQGAHIRLELADYLEDGGPWVRIGVRDDGPGIPPEQLAGLFDAFRQGDGSMTREVGGVGIGLPTAQKIAEAMHGRLAVESDLGKGTVFSVLLPGA